MITNDITIIIKVILSLLLVIGLMYIVLKAIQKYSKFGAKLNSSGSEVKIAEIMKLMKILKLLSCNFQV